VVIAAEDCPLDLQWCFAAMVIAKSILALQASSAAVERVFILL